MEDPEALACWHLSRILVKGEGENKELESAKSNLGDVLSKLVHSNVSQTGVWERSPQPPMVMGVWGQSPQPLGDFCNFSEKKSYFNPIGLRIARAHSHLKELDF